MKIPVNQPVISSQAKKNVFYAVNTGWLSSQGPYVKKFENLFAKRFGAKYAISVSSGTAALHVALLSLGIGPGDEVIVPAFTMAASWMSVIYTGARPVFVDCELETYNIDVHQIERKITKKTKAIMPVHIYGHACEMDAILKLAKKYRLSIIEDAAEACGGEYKKKKCGAIGDVGAFSFYANKIITTGEGGMIITNNKKIATQATKFRDMCHSDKKRFIHDDIGFNYRITNLQAAVGLGELGNIQKYIRKKIQMAKIYNTGLKSISGIKIPATRPGVKNIYWMYGIVVQKKQFGISRDTLRSELEKQGIDTRDFFYSPDDQPALKKYLDKEKFPNTRFLSENGLYLPSGLAITSRQIHSVISAIKKIHAKYYK